jgi:hypothetical protein
MSFLDQFKEFTGSISDPLSAGKDQGFAAPNTPSSDVGLPFTKVPYGNSVSINSLGTLPGTQTRAISKRHLINWFVPDMGVVKMYVNPEGITYAYRKAIKPTRTKGGYNIQYWGEELPTLTIRGNTGSSGVEGVNALYEVYRAEQYTFDSVGLTLSSNNAAENVAGSIFSSTVSSIAGSAVGGIANSLISPGSLSLSPLSVPSLANNAFTVEMYYMGWVFRGYFTNIEITENTDLLFTYNIGFTVTQRRGYRTNFLPWHKTPIGGGGDLGNHYDEGYDAETGTGTSPNYSFIK